MSSATLISVNEYLATSFRPDREMIEGQLIERNVGEYDHSKLQGALIAWFGNRQCDWNIRVLPSLRLRLSPSRFRTPDVSIISRDQPIEPVFTRPPLICIEVLSQDDTLRSMQARIDDYLGFGVPNIWILDPVLRRAYICNRSGLHEPEGGVLQVASSAINIALPGLFADLD